MLTDKDSLSGRAASGLGTDSGGSSSGPKPSALGLQGSTALSLIAGSPTTTPAEPPSYYTVQSGDSLSEIAAHVLHDQGAWLTLWNLNKAQIHDPSKLRIGMKLLLPTKAQLVEGGGGTGASDGAHTHTPTEGDDVADDASPTTRLGQAQALFRRYGGLIRDKASAIGLDPAVAAAIVLVESAGSGFKDDRLVIRFEPTVFRRLTGRRVGDSHRNQNTEYAAFEAAKKINAEAAYKSISMGAGQVMGFNAQSLGYADGSAMMQSFAADESNQITGMLQFIANNTRLVHAAQTGNWLTFARIYNGPKQRGYDRKLKNALVAARQAEESTKGGPDGSTPSTDGEGTQTPVPETGEVGTTPIG